MDNQYKRMRPCLGTFVEIGTLYEGRELAENAILSAFEIIETVHKLLSFHEPTSDLTKLNSSAGEEVKLHPLSLRIVKAAKVMTIVSGGLFNCTVGGILQKKGVLPSYSTFPSNDVGNAEDIEIRSHGVRLLKPLKITLDGIAKGFAVDLAIAKLKSSGLPNGWVNAGGDMRVYGEVTLPVYRRELNGKFTSLGGLRNLALCTSSLSNEVTKAYTGRIVSPTSDIAKAGTWTVLARHAWLADSLTKVACLSAPSSRHAIIRKLGGELLEVS